MISNLSSLIQLFAAIYMTMCFENTFLSRFWTQDPRKKIAETLEQLHLPGDVRPIVQKRTESLPESFEKRMRKRGTFMFFVSVFLLIVIGFEKGIATHTGYLGLSCSYILFALATVILFICDRRIMKEWGVGYRNIFIFFAVYTLLIIGIPFLPWYGPFWMQFCFWLKLSAKLSIIFAVVFPVVWSLYVNWLYSNYYLKYVISELEGVDDDEVIKERISRIDFYPDSPELLQISRKERRKEKKKEEKKERKMEKKKAKKAKKNKNKPTTSDS